MRTDLNAAFTRLSTPLIADACVRRGLPARAAPAAVRALAPGQRIAGRALPARHAGSVDIFLEAFERAAPGDVLAIDNGGRLDEACVGDLTVLEARSAGVVGVVVWGAHRDSRELGRVGVPVWSCGSCPVGPLAARPRDEAALDHAGLGPIVVSTADIIFADDDGVLAVSADDVNAVLEVAGHIADQEREQAEAMRAGTTLREQLRFADYLARREADPAYGFRRHLRELGGAVEE